MMTASRRPSMTTLTVNSLRGAALACAVSMASVMAYPVLKGSGRSHYTESLGSGLHLHSRWGLIVRVGETS